MLKFANMACRSAPGAEQMSVKAAPPTTTATTTIPTVPAQPRPTAAATAVALVGLALLAAALLRCVMCLHVCVCACVMCLCDAARTPRNLQVPACVDCVAPETVEEAGVE